MLKIENYKNPNEFVLAFESIFKSMLNSVKLPIFQYTKNFTKTETFQNIMYESGVFELSQYFDKRFFEDIENVVKAYVSIGTEDSYFLLIKSILGEQTQINFVYAPEFIIEISNSGVVEQPLLVYDESDSIEDYQNNTISTVSNRLGLESYEITRIIRYFQPVGTKIKITYIN